MDSKPEKAVLVVKPVLNYYTEDELSRLQLCLVNTKRPKAYPISTAVCETISINAMEQLRRKEVPKPEPPKPLESSKPTLRNVNPLLQTMEMFQQSVNDFDVHRYFHTSKAFDADGVWHLRSVAPDDENAKK
jgi:hypothetical protein